MPFFNTSLKIRLFVPWIYGIGTVKRGFLLLLFPYSFSFVPVPLRGG